MGEILDAPQSSLVVRRGDHVHRAESLRQGFEWLLQDTRKTVHVQRYKGLGEMNPEQLWDTTMDAETRNLMQVQIEDAIRADQIFSTLMGDHVEPRRVFIEEHALSVTNLDT
jgi:DNA gyrase subunit B